MKIRFKTVDGIEYTGNVGFVSMHEFWYNKKPYIFVTKLEYEEDNKETIIEKFTIGQISDEKGKEINNKKIIKIPFRQFGNDKIVWAEGIEEEDNININVDN